MAVPLYIGLRVHYNHDPDIYEVTSTQVRAAWEYDGGLASRTRIVQLVRARCVLTGRTFDLKLTRMRTLAHVKVVRA